MSHVSRSVVLVLFLVFSNSAIAGRLFGPKPTPTPTPPPPVQTQLFFSSLAVQGKAVRSKLSGANVDYAVTIPAVVASNGCMAFSKQEIVLTPWGTQDNFNEIKVYGTKQSKCDNKSSISVSLKYSVAGSYYTRILKRYLLVHTQWNEQWLYLLEADTATGVVNVKLVLKGAPLPPTSGPGALVTPTPSPTPTPTPIVYVGETL